ncbi:MAG: hypothetical protein KIT84_33605 [Labilithrix sp.]|nr:hypothetical protein [Labilithrix sp.]MCW5815984.1 hypothetical protein [Labilithrix sp.]
MSTPAPAQVSVAQHADSELEAELRRAVVDIEAGRCFTLTPEMAEQWAATGTCPGLDEWLAESDS